MFKCYNCAATYLSDDPPHVPSPTPSLQKEILRLDRLQLTDRKTALTIVARGPSIGLTQLPVAENAAARTRNRNQEPPQTHAPYTPKSKPTTQHPPSTHAAHPLFVHKLYTRYTCSMLQRSSLSSSKVWPSRWRTFYSIFTSTCRYLHVCGWLSPSTSAM